MVKEELYFLRYELHGDTYWTFGNFRGSIVKFLGIKNHLIKFKIFKGYKNNSLFYKGDVVWEEKENVLLYPLTKEDINTFVVDLL